MEYSDEVLSTWVLQVFESPKNLCSEQELREQAQIALSAFKESDNGDGQLTFEELRKLCENLGLPIERDEDEALQKMDSDGSGTLDLEEWMRWWLKRVSCSPNPAKQAEAIARHTFAKFDTDGSGSIDFKELKALISALGADFSEKELQDAYAELDIDGGGTIDMDEFISFWTNRSANHRKGGGLIAMKLRKLASKAQQTFFTDIFTATWNGDTELVKTFVESDARLGNASDESEFGGGWTPLHYAAYRGHTSIVKTLIDSKVQINKANNDGFTALFYAAQRCNIDICRLLLEAGADPTICGPASSEGAEELFFCPADFARDSKELQDMLKSHPRCSEPPAYIPSEKMNATIASSNGMLQIELPAVRSFTLLPIRKWKIEISTETTFPVSEGKEDSEPVVVIEVPGIKPSSPQLLRLQLDRRWLRARPQNSILSLRVAPTNCLGDEGPLSGSIEIVYCAPMASLQQAATLQDEGKDEHEIELETVRSRLQDEGKEDSNDVSGLLSPMSKRRKDLRSVYTAFDVDGDTVLKTKEYKTLLIAMRYMDGNFSRDEATSISDSDFSGLKEACFPDSAPGIVSFDDFASYYLDLQQMAQLPDEMWVACTASLFDQLRACASAYGNYY